MRFPSPILSVLLAAGCSSAHERPCESPAPPPPPPAPCVGSGIDEWAIAPPSAPASIPVRIAVANDPSYAYAVVLYGPPALRRITYRVGHADRSITIQATEAIGREWFANELARFDATALVCAPLAGGGELRLSPSREGTPAISIPAATVYDGALRHRDSSGAELWSEPLWLPDPTPDGRHCAHRYVRWRGATRLACHYEESALGTVRDCPLGCLENLPPDYAWGCTGETADGVAVCQPPP